MPSSNPDQQTDAAVIEVLRQARRLAVLTGAGISAESGIPTFRDAQTGMWAKFRPEELASPQAFERDPKLVWEWYAWRRSLVLAAAPNSGHRALAAMEPRYKQFTLITQNVDGLHRRAGSRNVLELHGNIHRARCVDEKIVLETGWDWSTLPPPCPGCGGLLRPDIVWFGEMLPVQTLEEAEAAAETCGVFLSVGTSSLVYPAAGLPLQALHAGATLIDINPEETPLSSYAHWSVRGNAGAILPKVLAQL